MAEIDEIKARHKTMTHKTPSSFDERQVLFYDCEDYFMTSISADFINLSQTATAYMTGVKAPHFNPLCLRLIGPSIGAFLEKARTFYDAHDIPWALTLPQDLALPQTQAMLDNFGFKKEAGSVAMIKILQEPRPYEQNSNIYPMDNRLAEWIRPLVLAFESDQKTAQQYRWVHARAQQKGSDFYHYSLYEGDMPIGSITVSFYHKAARIDDLGVLPSHQKQGYGEQLLRHALNEAAKNGAQACVLDASTQGARLYEKNGFMPLHNTQIYTYVGGS
jgi:GNAT superfamily N-acetyltransferase